MARKIVPLQQLFEVERHSDCIEFYHLIVRVVLVRKTSEQKKSARMDVSVNDSYAVKLLESVDYTF